MFNKTPGWRIHDKNLSMYLNGCVGGPIEKNEIAGFSSLIQANYGGTNDCTLTCITAVGSFKENYSRPIRSVYEVVEIVAKSYFYSPEKYGTIPTFTRWIIDKSFLIKSHVRYIKGIGYNWETIKKQIDKNNPVILSMTNDGRNYYLNHSVTVVGYAEYKSTGRKMLKVYDNWHNEISYVDYGELSIISSINYF